MNGPVSPGQTPSLALLSPKHTCFNRDGACSLLIKGQSTRKEIAQWKCCCMKQTHSKDQVHPLLPASRTLFTCTTHLACNLSQRNGKVMQKTSTLSACAWIWVCLFLRKVLLEIPILLRTTLLAIQISTTSVLISCDSNTQIILLGQEMSLQLLLFVYFFYCLSTFWKAQEWKPSTMHSLVLCWTPPQIPTSI